MIKESLLRGKRVLVADDDLEMRRAIIFDLKRRGCVVFEAACGEDGLTIARNNTIDIILTDVRMPKGSGVDLLREIRQLHPKIPVVFLLTGYADLSETEALEMGAYALIEKPVDRTKLLTLLENSCGLFIS